MPGRGPAGTCRPGDTARADGGAGRTPPACPGCGAGLRPQAGSTLACQQRAYSLEPAQ